MLCPMPEVIAVQTGATCQRPICCWVEGLGIADREPETEVRVRSSLLLNSLTFQEKTFQVTSIFYDIHCEEISLQNNT